MMPRSVLPDVVDRARCTGGGHRHRERALHRPRAAVERQLADDRVLVEQLALELPAAGENADGDRQIERAGLFGSSAGARLITTRSCGRTKPLLTIARSMRCVLSFTACSGRPTSTVFGSAPGETSTSTSTGRRRCPGARRCAAWRAWRPVYRNGRGNPIMGGRRIALAVSRINQR